MVLDQVEQVLNTAAGVARLRGREPNGEGAEAAARVAALLTGDAATPS